MSDGLNKLAKGIGEAIQTVPELYQDAFQPTVQETGKLLARIPRAINAAFSGLDKWILNKEYSIDETKKLLAQKLENVDPDKIVEPEPYVAIPAIQAISYSMNSEELRELYANLLANAMNSDTKDLVHPSFVEIIKQMSPMDAQIFVKIMNADFRPLISLKIKPANLNNTSLLFAEHCSWIKEYSLAQCRTSFDNLCRLGLITIPLNDSYLLNDLYNMVKSNPLFQHAESECLNNLMEGESIIYYKEYIKVNDLAKLFYKICIKDREIHTPGFLYKSE